MPNPFIPIEEESVDNPACVTVSVRGMMKMEKFLREARETAILRLHDSKGMQQELAGFELSSVEKRELWDLQDKLHNATEWLCWAEGRLNAFRETVYAIQHKPKGNDNE